MGKENFTLISRACIFKPACEQASGEAGVFASVFASIFLDILLIHGLQLDQLEFIQSWLFCPIPNSNKPYYEYCTKINGSCAVPWYLGLFCFEGWGSVLNGSRTRQTISPFNLARDHVFNQTGFQM